MGGLPTRIGRGVQKKVGGVNPPPKVGVEKSLVTCISVMTIHGVTVASFCSVSMPPDLCRHLVGKTRRNVCHCGST